MAETLTARRPATPARRRCAGCRCTRNAEIGRHLGRMDILREQIDGVTGR
ncbi:hypothetical protein [Nocardioides aquiterrae]